MESTFLVLSCTNASDHRVVALFCAPREQGKLVDQCKVWIAEENSRRDRQLGMQLHTISEFLDEYEGHLDSCVAEALTKIGGERAREPFSDAIIGGFNDCWGPFPVDELGDHIFRLLVTNERWEARATGDMTLSVCSFPVGKEKILTVDMLSQNTMRAGDSGERLARAYNDLWLLSRCPSLASGVDTPEKVLSTLPHKDIGISPIPWTRQTIQQKRSIVVKSAERRRICGRIFPKSTGRYRFGFIQKVLDKGIELINHAEERRVLGTSYLVRRSDGG